MAEKPNYDFRPDPERTKKAEKLQELLRETRRLRMAKATREAVRAKEKEIRLLEEELG